MDSRPIVQPYGTWDSPITAAMLAEKNPKFGHIDICAPYFYYIEIRPSESGRHVLMQGSLTETPSEALPKDFNVRTSLHEYGGKCFTVHQNAIYFVNYKDQDIYCFSNHQVLRITNLSSFRFADLVLDADHNFLYAVAEEHTGSQVNNMLIRINLTTHAIETIASGYDFYASPRISPDGQWIAWLCWKHPWMPWDGTELWLAKIGSSGLVSAQWITGGYNDSITHPCWSPVDHALYFTSDKSGYWNVYRYYQHHIEALHPSPIEFGAAQWILGSERLCFTKEGHLAAIGTQNASDNLYLFNTVTKALVTLPAPYTSISDLYSLDNTLLFIASSPSSSPALLSFDLLTYECRVLHQSQSTTLLAPVISLPQAIDFKTEQGLVAHGFYYPPYNTAYTHVPSELPPLILRCHGGPTTHVPPRFNLDTLFFTSRGFAVFEINYGGSTGYGSAYRNRLRRQWGVVDMQDCLNAANYLVEHRLADPKRLFIKGGSAGGYTVLQVLLSSHLFKAGVCYYAVSDLEGLVKDSHKLELHYLDSLIGPYPEDIETYHLRSPIHHMDKMKSPLLIFQGATDTVVPPSQSELLCRSLDTRKIPFAYILFEQEGHGFRQSSTIKRCLETELSFYLRILHLAEKKDVASLHIHHTSV